MKNTTATAVSTTQSATDQQSVNQLPWLGWLIAIGASVAFSIAPVVGRSALLAGMEPTELLVWRFSTAVLLIWSVTLYRDHRRERRKDRRKDRHEQSASTSGTEPIRARSFALISLVGLANGTAMICFFFGLARLEASITSMVLSTLPVVVLIILAFLGEPLTQRKIVRLVLAMAGLYLLIGPGGEVDMIGVGLIICAVLLFGGQLVITQSIVRKHDPQLVTRYVMTIMLLVITIYWWFQDGQLAMPNAQQWIYILLLGFVATFIARVFLYEAVKRVGSGQMSLLMPFETLLSITWSVLFLNERFSTIQWIGGLLILASAALAVQRLGFGGRKLRWRSWTRT